MNPLSDDPRYINMRTGMVICLAIVGDSVGRGAMASELLQRFCRPTIDQLDVDSVMLSQGVEGSFDDLCDGWRLAISQLARLIDKDGDFMLMPGRINRTWSSFCVDALRQTQKPIVNPVDLSREAAGVTFIVTTCEDQAGFGPLTFISYGAMLAEPQLGRLTVRHSLAVGRTREEATDRLTDAVTQILRLGQTVDLEYAHIVLV